ncbi:olfactory receptor 287-like [Canis lupus familiaris]|uniref:olfactory receptor 287-like n=1 Tax=Canis lupus familiaris TaxID=9615 RepID=UPI00004A7A27|nr:olfactory receptor 287-like [Canis lupus familiaris]|eukprot:XP_548816.1 olfactory receptor 287-like [Canis lupus familiaris]
MAWGRSQNQSAQEPFILLGFPGPLGLHVGLFALFLLMYVLAVAGNLAIIGLVGAHPRLRTPMYFFLCHLAFLEVWFTTACVPKALATLASRRGAISPAGCAAQMYFVFSLGCTEYFLLAAMAYDRYLAICRPLRYGSVMTPGLCARLALGCWLCGFSAIAVPAALIARLSFCGARVINHFFCDIAPWIALSCSDTRVVELASFGIAFCVILGSCSVTLLSYACIIATVVRIPAGEGRCRAFSTCSSHLTVVLVWYGSTIFLHVRMSAESSLDLTKAVTVLNTAVTPVLNPFIYTLRNREVREALWGWVQGK